MEPSSKPSSSRNKDWMFCPYTGAMLELDAVKNVAHCQVSGYSIGLDGVPQQAPAQLDPWESHRGTASHLLPAAALQGPHTATRQRPARACSLAIDLPPPPPQLPSSAPRPVC